MGAVPTKESNWLGAVSIVSVVMVMGVLGYYQFVFLPASLTTEYIPPPQYTINVSVIEGSIDPNNGNFYVPDEVTVVLGINHTIAWINDDVDILHTITAENKGTDFGEAASAGNFIDPGSSWSFTFTKSGEYKYFCSPHPHMRAVIHVLPLPSELITEEKDGHKSQELRINLARSLY